MRREAIDTVTPKTRVRRPSAENRSNGVLSAGWRDPSPMYRYSAKATSKAWQRLRQIFRQPVGRDPLLRQRGLSAITEYSGGAGEKLNNQTRANDI